MAKIHDIRALAEVHAQEISRSPKDWMGYLDTASRVYRYSFQDSLLIHAQRPNAIACAELELWNDKMLRWVNRGAKGIALLDNTGPKERLRYVFDITDTHPVPGGRNLFIWQLTPESQSDLLSHLTDAYGLEEKDSATVADALLAIAKSQAEENLEESIYGLSKELEDTFLDGLDEETIRTDYKELLTNSIFYTLARRCGLDPMEYLSEEDFTGITDYNKLSVLSFLGNATSSLCEPVLRDIGATMRAIERENLSEQLANSAERLYNKDVSFKDLKQESTNEGQTVQIEGGHEHGNELSSERGLPVPELSSDRGRTGSNREVRDASEDLPTGESPELVYEHDTDGKTEPAPQGDRDIGSGNDGELNARSTTEVSGTRQIRESAPVGSTHEQSDGDGGGDRLDGIGVQLTAETTEQDLSEAEEEIASALSLPEYPTVNQQKRAIEERQAARYAGEIALPTDVIDEVLRQGSNRDRGHLRLIYNFMAEKMPEEYMEFVKREYGTGGRGIEIGGQEYSAWWDELGMQIAVGHTVQDNILDKAFLSWEDVTGRIQQLLEQGEYAPQVVLDAARQNALAEHAEALVFMKSDLADGVSELVFDDPSIFDGSFPDAKERISRLLEQPEFLADLNDRLEGLAIAYSEDPEIMRFHYYKPDKVSEQFKQFAKEVVPYQAREDFSWQEHQHFITQDEIDSFLTKGGVFTDGRLSTYAYFIADHTDAEKVVYIKEQYGTGGSSHALSGADKSHAEYDAKGLTLARGDFGESVASTFLTWSKVAQRVNHLIETDQFLKPSDYSRMPEFEREQMAIKVLSFYLRLPDEISRPFTRDFLNESARKELPEILADPERAENLLAEMDSALAALPLDSESYEDHVRLLSELHQYVDGTFTIFPERKHEIEFTPIVGIQTNLFDVLSINEQQSLEISENEITESGESEIVARYTSSVYTQDGYVEDIAILKNPDGKFYNHYGFNAELGTGTSGAGPFDTFEDARQTMLAVHPDAEEVKEQQIEAETDLPTDAIVHIDGREFRIDSVDDTRGVVSLQDMTMAKEARYPIFRNESVDYVRSIYKEEEPKQEIGGIFEYQGYHFKAIGTLPKEITFKEASFSTSSHADPYLSDFADADMTYSHRDFYEASDVKDADIFQCIETGTVMIPGEHELFEYIGEYEPYLEQTIEADSEVGSGIDTPNITQEQSVQESSTIDPINFHITDDDLGAGGPKTKFRANIDAIKLLKELEADNRLATTKEQEVLSRFVGWGGIPQAFDSQNEAWSSEYAEVKELLTPEEYREARASTLNAFYTSPTVIKAMYSALENMGLKSGNVLEPSCGVGNFMGLVPESMDGLKMYGVELDSISGRIAGQLYQKNKIAVQGFETMDFPESFFDCTIGNVPFGDYKLNDPKYDRHNFLIHDYFIAKSLDLVRPGGVVAVVTSSGTMDKQNESVRRYLANRADLLGAIRLPNNAFMRNANTGVVADILFFQKRDRAALEEPDWVHLGQTQEGYTVNSYFAQHPEMVLGEFSTENTQYGKQETTVKPIDGAVLSEQLQEAVSHIHGTITEPELNDSELEDVDTSIPADPSVKNFSFANVDGQVYYRENSRMNLMELPKATSERVLGMIEIRNTTQELLSMQMEDCSDLELSAMQDKLNRQYDTFTAQYGLLSSSANRKAFSQDSSYCLLASLEIVDEEGNLQRKADIFSKRTIRRPTPVTTVDTASEALAVSIGEKAKVDLPFMAQLCGKTEDEVKEELSGVIFENPLTNQWETSDEYLSGNVREKLSVARQFAETYPEYSVNVAYLERVQPEDLEASDIEVRLGATWIKPEYIQQFMVETFHTPWRLARNTIGVHYAAVNGTWEITGKTQDYWNPLVNSTYGTTRANAYRLLEDALNLKDTKIYDTVEDPDGKERRVINKSETMLAQQKQEQIKAEFKEWIFQDIDRREDLCKTYNTLFNSIRPREYDGSHIQFGGMTPEISLMQHQKDAVAHVLYGGNTLLAHCVGAGKTFQMIAAGMESKRLGLSQKSLYVVPNHLTEQWGSDFLRLYPGANVLVATKKDFEPANRKKFCSRIATGNYDAVIIGHSQFERIPLSRERQVATIEKQIDDITVAIEMAKREDGTRTTVKQMEKTRRSLETRLEKLNNQTRKDDVVTFEQLGVDRLFVDESHNYKNLFLYTKMRNVAGITQTDAQKSSDMFMKCQYLDEITGGRGVTFATGTPVSNSMVELYTIMRYLQYDTLQKMGMGHFDSWAASFGETVTAIELAPEGTGYRAKTRFAKFYNLPELISLFKECADVQTADMLKLPVPEAEYVNVALKPSDIQKEMVESFAERAEEVRSGSVDSRVDNMLKITNDGRKCALDQRLISDMLSDDPNSKVNCCVDNAFSIWKDTAEDHSTQLIFCDLSTPKADGSFNVYDDVREKLVGKGIPKEEIAFIHEAATETKKAELFAKVRSGQVRILLGSTAKLGAGTNIQDRLIALHHLDCPWKPSDLEQQEGRILRQGNRNSKVKIFRYVTEGTFDAYMWQLLENKQKFISQIMTSKSPVRSAEDVDDTALSYAEIKALATGNPHIKEKMDLDIQVSKLKLLKSSHTSQIYRLESDIAKRYPKEIASTKERIAGLKSDLEVAKPILEQDKDSFQMVVGGKTYSDRKEAGVAVTAACAGLKAVNTTGQIGEYQGFTMTASFDMLNQKYMLTLKRRCSYTIEVGKDALGNIQRITNALAGIEKKLPEAGAKLENLQNQLATAKEEVLKPFPQAKELDEKSARLAELNSMLNMDSKVSNDVIGLDEEDQSEKAADKPRTALAFGEKTSVLDRLHEKQSSQAEKTKPQQTKKKSHEQEI